MAIKKVTKKAVKAPKPPIPATPVREKSLTARQVWLYQALTPAKRKLYLQTFLADGDTGFRPTAELYNRLKAPDVDLSPLDRSIARGAERFLKMFRQRNDIFNETAGLKPTEKSHPVGLCIGVEIECFSPLKKEAMQRIITRHKLSLKYIKCGADGSIESPSGYYPYEFRCMTRLDDMTNLRKLCDFLKEIHADVNATCGLHIHLDCRQFGSKMPTAIVENLRAGLGLLKRMLPEKRLSDYYCAQDVNTDSGDKYSKINTLAFAEHRTLEVRMHTATTNYEKISNWILICHSIAFGTAKPTDATSPDAYALALGWSDDLTLYVKRRIAKFAAFAGTKSELIVTRSNPHLYDADVNFEEVA